MTSPSTSAATSNIDAVTIALPALRYLPSVLDGTCISESQTPFMQSTGGVYLHGLLIGIGEGLNCRTAHLMACKSALETLESMLDKKLCFAWNSGGVAGCAVVHSDENQMHFGAKCEVCIATTQPLSDCSGSSTPATTH